MSLAGGPLGGCPLALVLSVQIQITHHHERLRGQSMCIASTGEYVEDMLLYRILKPMRPYYITYLVQCYASH